MKRFRSIAPRWLVAGSAVTATLVVLGGLVARQDATRSATEAHVPMRQPTAEEAAELLRESSANTALLFLSADEVVIGTRLYVLPASESPNGRKYRLDAANWARLYSRYELPRAPLEAALGRRLRLDQVQPRAFDDYEMSFAPSCVPIYVASEIIFLTAWLSLSLVAAQRVRRFTVVLPLLWVWMAVPLVFVFFYSPAFFDADFFFQRIVVERVALLGLLGAMALALPMMLSLAVFVALTGAERLARRGSSVGADHDDRRVERYRKRAMLGLSALAVAFLFQRTWSHWRDRGECLAELTDLESRLDSETLDAALQIPPGGGGNIYEKPVRPDSRAAVRRVLAVSSPVTQGRELQVYVPTGRAEDEVLFMWRRRFAYVDVRTLGPGFGRQADARFLVQLGTEPISSPWFDSVAFRGVKCGKRLRIKEREVTTAVGTLPWP